MKQPIMQSLMQSDDAINGATDDAIHDATDDAAR